MGYAETLQIPFVFSSNGDAFLFHDRTLDAGQLETEIPLKAFPSPDALWERYVDENNIPTAHLSAVAQPYHDDGSGKLPRYYQTIAINRAVEAVARGQNRLLLVMATGTGKTYVAFQTIWRLWKFTSAPEDFDDIRQSVLQFAIEGKLSMQKPDDPGDALLQQHRPRHRRTPPRRHDRQAARRVIAFSAHLRLSPVLT